MRDLGYTNGKPFLVTSVTSDGEYSRHVNYLLPDGTRKRITITLADDNPVMHAAIGDALVNERRRYGH